MPVNENLAPAIAHIRMALIGGVVRVIAIIAMTFGLLYGLPPYLADGSISTVGVVVFVVGLALNLAADAIKIGAVHGLILVSADDTARDIDSLDKRIRSMTGTLDAIHLMMGTVHAQSNAMYGRTRRPGTE